NRSMGAARGQGASDAFSGRPDAELQPLFNLWLGVRLDGRPTSPGNGWQNSARRSWERGHLQAFRARKHRAGRVQSLPLAEYRLAQSCARNSRGVGLLARSPELPEREPRARLRHDVSRDRSGEVDQLGDLRGRSELSPERLGIGRDVAVEDALRGRTGGYQGLQGVNRAIWRL